MHTCTCKDNEPPPNQKMSEKCVFHFGLSALIPAPILPSGYPLYPWFNVGVNTPRSLATLTWGAKGGRNQFSYLTELVRKLPNTIWPMNSPWLAISIVVWMCNSDADDNKWIGKCANNCTWTFFSWDVERPCTPLSAILNSENVRNTYYWHCE